MASRNWQRIIRITLMLTAMAGPSYAERTMIGTVEAVDATLMRINVKPDSGEPESFTVTNPYILTKLAKNDRVSVIVGDDGMVNEISKITAPSQDGVPSK